MAPSQALHMAKELLGGNITSALPLEPTLTVLLQPGTRILQYTPCGM